MSWKRKINNRKASDRTSIESLPSNTSILDKQDFLRTEFRHRAEKSIFSNIDPKSSQTRTFLKQSSELPRLEFRMFVQTAKHTQQ